MGQGLCRGSSGWQKGRTAKSNTCYWYVRCTDWSKWFVISSLSPFTVPIFNHTSVGAWRGKKKLANNFGCEISCWEGQRERERWVYNFVTIIRSSNTGYGWSCFDHHVVVVVLFFHACQSGLSYLPTTITVKNRFWGSLFFFLAFSWLRRRLLDLFCLLLEDFFGALLVFFLSFFLFWVGFCYYQVLFICVCVCVCVFVFCTGVTRKERMWREMESQGAL